MSLHAQQEFKYRKRLALALAIIRVDTRGARVPAARVHFVNAAPGLFRLVDFFVELKLPKDIGEACPQVRLRGVRAHDCLQQQITPILNVLHRPVRPMTRCIAWIH